MTPTLYENPTLIHANVYAVFFPPINLRFDNAEPGNIGNGYESVKGLVTGVPKLGVQNMVAFLGEPFDITNWGAKAGVNHWGDATPWSATPSTTHTYGSLGYFWITASDSDGGPAKAARLVKVISRDPSVVQIDAVNNESGWPVKLEETTQMSITGISTIKGEVFINQPGITESDLGYIKEGVNLVVFAEIEHRTVALSTFETSIICSGYINKRSITETSKGATVAFEATSLNMWIQQAQMRPMQFTDIASMGNAFMQEMFQNIQNNPLPVKMLNSDINSSGYIPPHIGNCRPELTGAHLIQHLRYSVNYAGVVSPTMYNYPNPTSYGMLSQFVNFLTDADFDETVLPPGMHGYSSEGGSVWSGVNNILNNEGAMWHMRMDGQFVFKKKPYYKTVQDDAVLAIDYTRAGNGFNITWTHNPPVYKVIVMRPVLANNAPAGDPVADWPTPTGTIPLSGAELVKTMIYDPDHSIIPIYNPLTVPTPDIYAGAGAAATSQTTAANNNADDFQDSAVAPLQLTIDVNKYQLEYECGPVGGEVITAKNVYATDLEAFARGLCAERNVSAVLTASLGDFYQVDVGDVVVIPNYERVAGVEVSYSEKLWWVTSVQVLLKQGRYYTRQIVAVEIVPDDV